MMKRLFWAAILVVAACAPVAKPGAVNVPAAAAPACIMSDADRAWIERAMEAWRFTSREITKVQVATPFQAVLFDAGCTLTSPDALTAATAGRVAWRATPHGATVPLPDGQEIPAGVISFTSADDASAFFVMSTPSVWRANGVDNLGIGLETMMTAVLLHEASHVAQSASYGKRITRLAELHHLPDSFNDDSLQNDFEGNGDFSASVARETDLFFQAAAAHDDSTALRLARQARDMMKARAARWFVGDKAYYLEAEDLWLTFEGSGQWAGYRWLIDPRGAAQPVDVALPNFARRGKWWSQTEGLAVALTLDRLGAADWTHHAFGDGSLTLLQMLDARLARR